LIKHAFPLPELLDYLPQFRIEIGETAIEMGAHYSAHLSALTPASYHPGTVERSKLRASWFHLLSEGVMILPTE
jgi:hypothetical protein